MRPLTVRLRLGILAVGLLVATLVALAAGTVRFATAAPGADVLVHHSDALIALAVAWMAWFRHGESDEGNAIVLGSAFLLLGATSVALSVAAVSPAQQDLGLTLESPGDAQQYAAVLTRAAAAALLIVALATPPFVFSGRDRAVAMFVAPAALALIVLPLIWLAEPLLPPLIGPPAVESLSARVDLPGVLQGQTTLAVMLHLGVGFLFLVGAARAAALAKQAGPRSSAYLASGLLVLGFAQIHEVIAPGGYATLLTSGDLLRLAAYGLLLVGLYVESREVSSRLREASLANDRLREIDATRAALEERTLLAREIHDGLAQNLWLAKLRLEDVARAANLDEARRAADVVGTIVDEGIVDARRSLLALRSEAVSGVPLAEVLEHQVTAFSRETGLIVEVETDGRLGELSPRAGAELLRIVSEALTNVIKHADATLVRLESRCDGRLVKVRIADNGIGFTPGEHRTVGVGLQGMCERAALVGGRVVVESAPQSGTVIIVELPVVSA